MTEEQFKENVAKRLIELRKSNELTQIQLAEKLNYSDKTISKWERKEALPDAFVLYKIASFYQIPVSFFYNETDVTLKKNNKIKKLFQSLSLFLVVWLIATIVYTLFSILHFEPFSLWKIFLYFSPLAFFALLKYTSKIKVWAVHFANISLIFWLCATSLFFIFIDFEMIWLIFVLAGVIQVLFAILYLYKHII